MYEGVLTATLRVQVLECLHKTLQAVQLQDPLLRVSVGLRLALHLEAGQNLQSACTLVREVRPASKRWSAFASANHNMTRTTLDSSQ